MPISDLPDLLASLDVPMIVVTAADDQGGRAGCLVGFHAQCSIDPPRYAVWISKANHTLRVALGARHIAVHVLSDADGDLAELFGSSTGDQVDKFEQCAIEEGPDGVPLLRRCPNRIVARRHSVFDDGSDHVCFVLEPVQVGRQLPLHPLRYSDVRDLTPGHEAGDSTR